MRNFLLFIFCIFSCKNFYSSEQKLNILFSNMETKVTKEELLVFKNTPIDSIHELNCPKKFVKMMEVVVDSNQVIQRLFEDHKVSGFGARQLILLDLWNDRLNLRKFDIEKHHSRILEDWESAKKLKEKCEEKKINNAKMNYNSFSIGDTLLVRYPVTDDGFAYVYGCPHANTGLWAYDSNRDLEETVKLISKEKQNVVFLLWGGYAKKKKKLIDTHKHFVLDTGHPSPLSANRGFWFGNKHFSRTNSLLQQSGFAVIEWRLA